MKVVVLLLSLIWLVPLYGAYKLEGSSIVLTPTNNVWEMRFPAGKWRKMQEKSTQDGKGKYYYFFNPEKLLMVSFFIEPVK